MLRTCWDSLEKGAAGTRQQLSFLLSGFTSGKSSAVA